MSEDEYTCPDCRRPDAECKCDWPMRPKPEEKP